MTFELNGSGVKAFGWATLAFALLVFGFLLVSIQFDVEYLEYFETDMIMITLASYLAILGGILMVFKGGAAQGVIVALSALSMIIISESSYVNLVAIPAFLVVMVIMMAASYKGGDSNTPVFCIFMLLFLFVECIYRNEWIDIITDADAVVGAICIVAAAVALIIAYKEIAAPKDEEE